MAEPLAPAQVIAHCCELMALPASEAGVQLVTFLGDNLPEMIADRRALNQILLNLVSNAIRFSDRGGKVVVGAVAEADAVLFTVEDHGVGMSEEDQRRVGEPYFQARASYDRRHGGTGLGLSIVKGLVRLHGGELSFRSRTGEGTRVTVRLPRDCGQVRPAGKASAKSAAEINRVDGPHISLSGDPATLASREDLSLPTEQQVKKSA
jgi:two-component system, cell cycle sensor histidine kinase DivJ